MGQAWPGFPRSCPRCWVLGAWGMHGMQGQAGGMLLSSPRWKQWPGLIFSRNSCSLGLELGVGCTRTLSSKGLPCWDVSKRCYNLSAPWYGDRGYFCSLSLKGLSSHHCDTRELSGLIVCPWDIKALLCLLFLLQGQLIKMWGGFTSTWACFSAVSCVWQNLSSKFYTRECRIRPRYAAMLYSSLTHCLPSSYLFPAAFVVFPDYFQIPHLDCKRSGKALTLTKWFAMGFSLGELFVPRPIQMKMKPLVTGFPADGSTASFPVQSHVLKYKLVGDTEPSCFWGAIGRILTLSLLFKKYF